MNPQLAQAMARLHAALGALESATGRYLDSDLRRSDLETELAVMQEDRGRLAAELESASARLDRVETASDHVGRRVAAAIGSLGEVVARLDGAEAARG